MAEASGLTKSVTGDDASRPSERLLAGLATCLSLAVLWQAQSGLDVALCLLSFAYPAMVLAQSPLRRRRELLLELPAILLGTFAVSALIGVSMAAQLDAPTPWLRIAGFGSYIALWVLALRVLHRLLVWLAAKCARPPAARAVAGLLLLGLAMPQLFVALQTRRVAIGDDPYPYFARDAAREVAFDSSGLRLRGTWFENRLAGEELQQTPVVIVCHGLGANRSNVLPYAAMAWQQGCHVLAFDFRGHGQSAGLTTTLGGRERDDVVAAAQWVRSLPGFGECPMVLLGVSMGAASALRAAHEVGASGVFAESSYADLDAMVSERLAMLGPIRPFACWSVAFAAWLQLGMDVAQVSPRRSLAQLPVDVPVVLLHAGRDQLIPVAEGRKLAAAREGLELLLVPGADHAACLHHGRRRVKRLLRGLLADVRNRSR